MTKAAYLTLMWIAAIASCMAFSSFAHAQVADTISLVHWELGRGGAIDRSQAIVAVLDYLEPDGIVVTGVEEESDVAIVEEWFSGADGSDSIEYAYFIGARVLVVTKSGRLDLQISASFPTDVGEQTAVLLRSRNGYCYSLALANWSEPDQPDMDTAHYVAADALLTMARSFEEETGCRGRVIVTGTFHASSSTDAGLSLLTESDFLLDPVVDLAEISGSWDYSSEYARLHTTSTTSGLSRRTAMTLISSSMIEDVVSWSVFGNDSAHYSLPLDSGDHGHLSPEIIAYLQSASETLPQLLRIREKGVSSVAEYPLPGITQEDLR